MTDETTAPDGAATAAAPQGISETSAPQTDAAPTTAIPGDAPATPEAKPKGVQKRIDELTGNWRNAERDRDYWREQAIKGQQPPAPVVTGKPTLEQFEFDQEKFLEALADWKLNERDKAAETKRKETEAKEAAEKRTKTFVEREAKYAAGKDDYRSVAEVGNDPSFICTPAMAEAILEAEEGPALLHYLDTHRDEAARIAQMSPTQTALALGRIIARPAAPEPVAPQIPTAPKPVPVVKASAPLEKGLSDELPVKEWLARRNKDVAKKRG
jgi:hypothetical protein